LKFPSKASHKKIVTEITNGFIDDLNFENFDEHGCTVRGELTRSGNLEPLDDLNLDLESLMKEHVTRKERTSDKDPLACLSGPVLITNVQEYVPPVSLL
jgi:hypothetical protein